MSFDWLKNHRAAAVIAATYLLLAVMYGLANPPFEATDEIRHFRYIRYLATNWRLPPVSIESSKELQAHHPPLYYLTAAALTAAIPGQVGPDYSPPVNPFWGFRYFEPSTDNKNQYIHGPGDAGPFASPTAAAVYGARWLSSLFGLGVVILAYRLGRLIDPASSSLGLGAMAFAAFNPNLLHSAASVNNDAAAAFFGAWAIYEAVRVGAGGRDGWSAARFGLAIGLGLLSKVSVGALAALACVAWLPLLRRDPRALLRDAAIAAGLALAVAGWWFARNYLASGDPMGLSDYQSAWQGSADRGQLIHNAIAALPYAWTTAWARLDYGQVVLPDAAYAGWTVVVGLAAVGLIRSGRQLMRMDMAVLAAAMVLSLGGWAALMVTIPATSHARHILYVYPAFGVLVTHGLQRLVPNFGRWSAPVLAVGSLGFAGYTLFGYLAPAFAYPAVVTQLPPGATQAAADFEGAAAMVGYSYSPHDLRPGGRTDVTVFWKPLARTQGPLQVFVHLVDSDGIIAAQRDTYPGLGRAPSESWRVGQIFADTYSVYIPDTAYAPQTLTIRVGLWQTGENRPLVTGDSDSVVVGSIALAPNAGDLPNPLAVNFDNRVTLISYSVDKRVLKAGGSFQLQTYWRIGARLDDAYWAYAHLVGSDGKIWALADSVILPFTTQWDPGKVNGETRPITISPDTPPGQYSLEFGISRVLDGSQQLLPVVADDGHGIGDHVTLAPMRVEP